jgi:phosphoribosylformylglycinamidine (FGAM) synthase-like enzyme
MDAKIHQGVEAPGLVLISAAGPMWAPSHAALVSSVDLGDAVKPWDLARCVTASRFVAALIQEGLVEAAHDCSEGGLLVAIAEILIAGFAADHPVGAALFMDAVMDGDADSRMLALFGEAPGRYVLQVPAGMGQAIVDRAQAAGVGGEALGILTDDGRLDLFKDLKSIWMSTPVQACREAFTGTLDW